MTRFWMTIINFKIGIFGPFFMKTIKFEVLIFSSWSVNKLSPWKRIPWSHSRIINSVFIISHPRRGIHRWLHMSSRLQIHLSWISSKLIFYSEIWKTYFIYSINHQIITLIDIYFSLDLNWIIVVLRVLPKLNVAHAHNQRNIKELWSVFAKNSLQSHWS